MTRCLISAGLLCWMLSGCGTGGVGAPDSQNQPTQQGMPVKVEPQVVDANLSFGLRLLNVLDEQREKPNLFMSPLSASVALSMMLNGAGGETYAEMIRTLGYARSTPQEINQQSEALIQLLRTPDPEAKVDLANSLWVQENFTLRPEFVRALQSHYGAVAERLNFAGDPEGAANLINAWVKE
ncbi:MAG: serpin family protein, partial [Fimbriimonadales bacterium]